MQLRHNNRTLQKCCEHIKRVEGSEVQLYRMLSLEAGEIYTVRLCISAIVEMLSLASADGVKGLGYGGFWSTDIFLCAFMHIACEVHASGHQVCS